MLTDDFLKGWRSVLLPVSTDRPPYLVSLASIPQGNVSNVIRPEVPLWYPKPKDGLQTAPGYLTPSADIPYCFAIELVPHNVIYKSFRGLDAFIPRNETPRINYGMIGSIMFVSRRCGPNLEEALQHMRLASERSTGSSEIRTVYMYFDGYVCGERIRTPVVEVQATLIERRRVYGDMSHRIFTLALWISADSNEYPWLELGDRVFPLWVVVPFLDIRGLRTLILGSTLRAIVVHLPPSPFVAIKQGPASKKVPVQEDPLSPENVQREIRYICAQSRSPLCGSAKTLEDLLRLKISAAYTMPLAYFDYAFVANLKARDVFWYLEELWNLLFYKRSPIEYEVLSELERLEALRKDEEAIRDMVESGIVASAGEEGEKKEGEKFVPWAVEIPQRVKVALEMVVHPKLGITFAEEIRDFLAFVDRGPLYACRERK